MHKWLGLTAITMMFLNSSCDQQGSKPTDLRSGVEAVLKSDSAIFGLAFKDLSTGETLFINEKESFHAASTMKTPVMIEVYKQAAKGIFSLNDSIEVKNSFSSIVDSSPYSLDSTDDSEKELYKVLGSKRTIYQLTYDMIIYSSNLATNMVIELVKADSVMQTMRSIGANDIRVLRGVEDSKAFQKGLNNTTTAYDLLLIFEKMAKGELVDQASSDAMIRILLDQHFNEIIPAELPAEVKVAHKTGSINGIQHDSGIVFLPDGRKYVLVLLSRFKGPESVPVAQMSKASKLIYDHVVKRAGASK
ncbi:class A beta-lactamase-related serine hydrolase [Flavihumibacter rivuli]|uniref:serine hydrolase n=1 Tax=Flavihumibacter rivuli TaxID=2838156 RepID=UPI001EFBF6F6|nr:serine hydrolase [Flavihumibacter rivuli]ULQ57244.1 class A beta-lactamase-related serine hydrolase [Flavihumibacter rivuli]